MPVLYHGRASPHGQFSPSPRCSCFGLGKLCACFGQGSLVEPVPVAVATRGSATAISAELWHTLATQCEVLAGFAAGAVLAHNLRPWHCCLRAAGRAEGDSPGDLGVLPPGPLLRRAGHLPLRARGRAPSLSIKCKIWSGLGKALGGVIRECFPEQIEQMLNEYGFPICPQIMPRHECEHGTSNATTASGHMDGSQKKGSPNILLRPSNIRNNKNNCLPKV